MTSYAYQTLALILPDSEATRDLLCVKLAESFPNIHLKNEHSRVIMNFGNWQFFIYYNDAPHVIIESQEIAYQFATDREDKGVIAACKARFELYGELDPNMDYFNDYICVLQELETFTGVILFDPKIGEFI